jgi:serine/threonine protein kinase
VSEHGVQAGRLLGGRYLVDSMLGRGGMASVWSGMDQQMGRQIAIKVLHLNASDSATAWARFEREVRSTAAVNDPHIVTVHDTGIDHGTAYLVLELLPGPTLSQHLTEHGPMPIPAVLDVTAQICDALAAAHALGIVHRDIKPSNVMFANHHRVKVLDFGITQLIGEATTSEATLTATGESLGTPAFMAPEQIEGRRVDARTDLYALGCLITSMLSGRPPFPDSSPWSVIASHAHDIPPDVRLARPDTPPELAALVASLLAKDPQQRPATAADVLNTVHHIATSSSHPPTARHPTQRRRNHRLAIAAAGVAAIAAAAGLYTAAGSPGLPKATVLTKATAEPTPTPSSPSLAASSSASPSAEPSIYGIEQYASKDWKELSERDLDVDHPLGVRPGTSVESIRALFGSEATEARLDAGDDKARYIWTWQGVELTARIDTRLDAVVSDFSDSDVSVSVAPDSPWVVAAPQGVILGHHSLRDVETAYQDAAEDSTVESGQEEVVAWVEARFLLGGDGLVHLYKTQIVDHEVPYDQGCGQIVRGFEVHDTSWFTLAPSQSCL